MSTVRRYTLGKKVTIITIKPALCAGKAVLAPAVGPALSQHGVDSWLSVACAERSDGEVNPAKRGLGSTRRADQIDGWITM